MLMLISWWSVNVGVVHAGGDGSHGVDKYIVVEVGMGLISILLLKLVVGLTLVMGSMLAELVLVGLMLIGLMWTK